MENIKEKAENKIIDWIAFESDGRLMAEKPEKGADLIIQKKGDYPAKKLFLNLEVSENSPENKQNFQENYFLLVVDFDFIKQEVEEKFWLAPVFKEQIDKKTFINFLIQKLVVENKPKSRENFKPKVY
jgi:hypothetical protein